MRKSLRLVLATASGVAIFATGAAITVASPANAGISSVRAIDIPGAVDINDTFLPPTGNDTMGFSFVLEDPYIDDGVDKGKPARKLWAQFTRDNSGTPTWLTASITQPAAVAAGSVTADSKVTVNGTIPVSSGNTPGDKWQLRIGFTAPGVNDAPTSWEKTTPAFTVAKATRVTGVSIDPDPVYLKSGKEIDVTVEAKVEKYGGETIKDVRLEDDDESEHYPLTTSLEDDGSYHDSTSMDYSTVTGDWRLKFTITRGSKTYTFGKGFEVRKSSSAKATSRITLYASPAKVKKGKNTKLYGKVYRGSKGWSSKILRLYFKKKGAKKWSFVGYVQATSTGKYTKTVKPKYDGYWRTRAMATSKTYGSLSNYKFVDVK